MLKESSNTGIYRALCSDAPTETDTSLFSAYFWKDAPPYVGFRGENGTVMTAVPLVVKRRAT